VEISGAHCLCFPAEKPPPLPPLPAWGECGAPLESCPRPTEPSQRASHYTPARDLRHEWHKEEHSTTKCFVCKNKW